MQRKKQITGSYKDDFKEKSLHYFQSRVGLGPLLAFFLRREMALHMLILMLLQIQNTMLTRKD